MVDSGDCGVFRTPSPNCMYHMECSDVTAVLVSTGHQTHKSLHPPLPHHTTMIAVRGVQVE